MSEHAVEYRTENRGFKSKLKNFAASIGIGGAGGVAGYFVEKGVQSTEGAGSFLNKFGDFGIRHLDFLSLHGSHDIKTAAALGIIGGVMAFNKIRNYRAEERTEPRGSAIGAIGRNFLYGLGGAGIERLVHSWDDRVGSLFDKFGDIGVKHLDILSLHGSYGINTSTALGVIGGIWAFNKLRNR